MVHGTPRRRRLVVGRPLKVYPPEQVEYVRRAYASGMTQTEIAVVLGTYEKDIWKLMARNGLARRQRGRAPGRFAGERSPGWKGEAVGYDGLHTRLAKLRGKANRCTRCGTTDPAKRYEWANLTGNYADPNDYQPMCRACHRRFDDGRAMNQKRCCLCGRVGARSFRTIPQTTVEVGGGSDTVGPFVKCMVQSACFRRQKSLKGSASPADTESPDPTN